MKARFIQWSISSAVLIAGCSGGGGDSIIGGSSPPQAELVEITSANAKTVAAGAMLSALEGGNFGTLAIPGTAQVAATSTKTTPLYSKVGAVQVERETALVKPRTPVGSQAPVAPTTTPCDVSGSATVSGEVASQDTISTGDQLTLTFAACDDGSAIVDGSLSMTVTNFEGSLETGQFLLSVNVELTALQITEAGETVAADGDASMTLDALSSPTLEITLASESLTVDAGALSQSVSDYRMSQSIDTLTGDYSVEASGGVSSSAFEGLAQFETVEPFVGLGFQHPYLGELLITGANGATIRAVALDSQFVRLEVDTDGDGDADFVEDITWDELTA